MSTYGPPDSLGSGFGRAESHARFAFELTLAAWDASAGLAGWIAKQRQPTAAAGSPRARARTATAAPHGGPPQERHYALSTIRRYRQIGARFAAWGESLGLGLGTTTGFTAFLAAVADDTTGSASGTNSVRRDPQHRALLRTTICAVRAVVDIPLGLELATTVRLPPRPQPILAADLATVATLRRAAKDDRERLLVVLTCDLGLRPGQMAQLRWGDLCLHRNLLFLSARRGGDSMPIPASCRGELVACTRGHAPTDFLFPSPQRGRGWAATIRTLQNALCRLAGRAGAPYGTTFASLRKTCLANSASPAAEASQPGAGAAGLLHPKQIPDGSGPAVTARSGACPDHPPAFHSEPPHLTRPGKPLRAARYPARWRPPQPNRPTATVHQVEHRQQRRSRARRAGGG